MRTVVDPPPATPIEPVTEVLHGVEITDPYRWLEDQNSPLGSTPRRRFYLVYNNSQGAMSYGDDSVATPGCPASSEQSIAFRRESHWYDSDASCRSDIPLTAAPKHIPQMMEASYYVKGHN
jgi:hypothetical protein